MLANGIATVSKRCFLCREQYGNGVYVIMYSDDRPIRTKDGSWYGTNHEIFAKFDTICYHSWNSEIILAKGSCIEIEPIQIIRKFGKVKRVVKRKRRFSEGKIKV